MIDNMHKVYSKLKNISFHDFFGTGTGNQFGLNCEYNDYYTNPLNGYSYGNGHFGFDNGNGEASNLETFIDNHSRTDCEVLTIDFSGDSSA